MSSPSSTNPFRAARLNSAQDYEPEWDVHSVHDKVSEWLGSAIHELRGWEQPDPAQVIPVLLAPPGYGKTHLFGRIAHQLGHEALFVFVPQIEDIHRPLQHIRWHAVESLFGARLGATPVLSRVLAGLCQQSFVRYLEELPPSLAARYQQLQRRLREEPLAALEIVASVTELAPFLKLADSVAQAVPQLRTDIVRGLLLGWSPEAATVRRWLRGESLPEDDLARLRLEEEPPEAGHVLLAIATLLRFQMPIVLCCDQMDAVLVELDEGPARLSNALVGLLQSVPNQLVVMSCLEDKWANFLDRAHSSFQARVRPFKLQTLTESQAVELVRRRLKTWPGARPQQGETWPFREDAVKQLAQKNLPGPRGLIQVCAEAFDRWAEEGTEGWIERLIREKETDDLALLFLKEWDKELEAVKSDPGRSARELPEERLLRAIKEALDLGRGAGAEGDGVRLASIQDTEVRWSANKRPALKLGLKAGPDSFAVIVAVTKIDNGKQFQGYFNALEKLWADPVAGGVLVHPRTDLRMGPVTQAAFNDARKKGKLRTFPLVEHEETAARLECLLSLLDRARANELQLGALRVSDKDCIDLAIKTAVMANVDLFAVLGANWPSVPRTAEVALAGARGRTATATAGPGSGGRSMSPGPQPDGLRQQAADLASVGVQNEPAAGAAAKAAQPSARGMTGGDGPDAWTAARLNQLTEKLRLWSLPVEPDGFEIGPTFARLRVRPQGKTSVNRVRNKAEDLKIHLGLQVPPLIDAQAGYISVDVQLPNRQSVTLDEVLATPPPGKSDEPTFPVGRDVLGKTHWLNLAEPADCHLLVAGTTGSGKSEFLKALLAALARQHTYQQLQFLLVDPKQVTFNFGGESPYFLHPVARAADEALPLILECFEETERRYALLKERRLENLAQLQGPDALPRIIVVIDEFADLMADKDSKKALEKPLKRIGALARAAGIHLVLATQRPEASVVTPLLRSNLPGRISLKVASDADSKLILGVPDASRLLGLGDLLWKHGGGLLRLQSPLVSRRDLDRDLRLS